MRRHGFATILIATLVVLAGCAGSVDPGAGTTDDASAMTSADGSATVDFYVSDEQNAIDDFEHLNVTITQVGFQQAESEADDETDELENETATNGPENETVIDESENETATDEPETELPENETATDEPETELPENETATENASEESDEDDGWTTRQVDNRTVDLTRLQGANATQLTSMNVSNGTYTKVFVYVSEVNATLENGEQVTVKLPSEKLQLNKAFTIGDGEAVDFVFDITVKQAGNSGKYILRPVVGESGTSDDVEIRKVDDRGKELPDDAAERGDDDRKKGENGEDRSDATALNATFLGEVSQGENATVRVLRNDTAVENASVTVNGEAVGATDAAGELTFSVPDVTELEVEITAGEDEAELERRFAGKSDDSGGNAGNGNDDADYDYSVALA